MRIHPSDAASPSAQMEASIPASANHLYLPAPNRRHPCFEGRDKQIGRCHQQRTGSDLLA